LEEFQHRLFLFHGKAVGSLLGPLLLLPDHRGGGGADGG
jgi:hypothetical protein